jgi:polyhydroxybutyrate depolymerase
MKNTNKFHLWIVVLSILFTGLASCNQVFATPTPTPLPTNTPVPTATPFPTLAPGNMERTVTVNDVERSYIVHVPSSMDNSQPVAVVFVFHGYSGDAADIQLMTGFDETADKAGFIVVYPEGISFSWNAGVCCGSAADREIDEPDFVREMLSDLGTIVSVDSKRIYATGFSNGGMLSYCLACEMSDVLAAVGPVGGVLTSSPCEPQEPVSLIHVHALNDQVVPFASAAFPNFPSAKEDITNWVQINECTEPATTEKLLNDILTHTAYTSCKNNTAVELYTFETGGHTWPSKYVWDTSQALWDFFAAHPKP